MGNGVGKVMGDKRNKKNQQRVGCGNRPCGGCGNDNMSGKGHV